MTTKTVSVRLESELISEIESKCNSDGCCRNDFIKNAISEKLSGNDEPVSEARVTAVSYDDGKTWIDVD